MYIKSSYSPLPPLPTTNFHNFVWHGPGREEIPDHVMQIDAITGQRRTRTEFIERMYDGATALGTSKQAGGLGLTSRDMVAILSDNCLDYIVLVHSLLVIATPFVPFSTYATPREMSHSLAKSKATHIFVHASLLPSVLPVARQYGFPDGRVYTLEGKPNTGMNILSFGKMIEKVRHDRIPRVPVREVEKDTLAYLVFSSGTSGLPKAVMISHGNLVCSVVQGASALQESENLLHPRDPNITTVLCYLPFSHSYNLHSGILKAPLLPYTHIVMPRWNLNLALRIIPKYRVTDLLMIPSVIHQLANSPQFAKLDLSSITFIGSGAAYLPPKLSEKFRSMISTAIPVIEGYGMSEATMGVMLLFQPGVPKGSVGPKPEAFSSLLPGIEGRILRPDGTHCLPGEPGELYIKGGNVALGYWNDPKATKENFLEDGWLKTGDVFKATSDGKLYFVDRSKDTLKVSGMQVAPAEIEDVLLAEPSGLVVDVAVAGVEMPSARTSDDLVPCAWVVLSKRGRQMPEDQARAVLEKWAQENLSKYKWLRGGIHFTQEIPKSATGKVLRRVLREQYASVRRKL